MFEVNCRHCGETHYITGLTREEWDELQREKFQPDSCCECGEIV